MSSNTDEEAAKAAWLAKLGCRAHMPQLQRWLTAEPQLHWLVPGQADKSKADATKDDFATALQEIRGPLGRATRKGLQSWVALWRLEGAGKPRRQMASSVMAGAPPERCGFFLGLRSRAGHSMLSDLVEERIQCSGPELQVTTCDER